MIDVVDVHLLDGTYELFRHHFALPDRKDAAGVEVAATRGVVMSVVSMLADGVTHLAVATDHTVESFRNDLYEGYKTGEGLDPELFGQFTLVEDTLAALGVAVLPMVEYEADDGLASGVRVARDDERVARILVCTPDKDLAQCVEGDRIVQVDRRKGEVRNEDGVRAKFGVGPASIPDWLALTGDTADGFPGLPGWGAKSSASVLARYGHIEAIPRDGEWEVAVRGAARLAAALDAGYEDALLFRDLATLRDDAPVGTVDDWRWTGPAADFAAWCERLGLDRTVEKVAKLAAERA
ncbi:MAG: 5'-3' exonuclease H3TH domain-containing protein [Actinomycetes bacterium]